MFAEEDEAEDEGEQPKTEKEGEKDGEEEEEAEKAKKTAGKRGGPSKKAADDEEEEAKKTVKKQKQGGKKSTKIKEEKLDEDEEADDEETKKKAKKPGKTKKPTEYKKGKFNPFVEELTVTPQLENPSDDVIDYKSTKSNNRNIIRAAYTKNHTLLQKVFTSGKLSTFFDVWGPENNLSAMQLIFKNKDKKGLEIFLDSYQGIHSIRAPWPQCFLREINTGYNSIYTFGVRVRKVNMARGGREGNNAFIGDLEKPSGLDDKFYEKISVMNVDPHMVDILQAKLGRYGNILADHVHLAVKSGNKDLALHVITQLNKQGGYGFTETHELALIATSAKEVAQVKRVSVTKKTVGKLITPLFCACYNPNKAVLEKLLEICPEYTLPDETLRKPVHYAASCVGSGPLEVLLSKGVDMREGDQLGITPLMIAAIYGRAKNVRFLLEKEDRSNIAAKNKEGMMAIHLAAMVGHTECIKELLKKDVAINAPGKFRMTPLMFTAAYGHLDSVKFLLEEYWVKISLSEPP